jgi:hypothetical protein
MGREDSIPPDDAEGVSKDPFGFMYLLQILSSEVRTSWVFSQAWLGSFSCAYLDGSSSMFEERIPQAIKKGLHSSASNLIRSE